MSHICFTLLINSTWKFPSDFKIIFSDIFVNVNLYLFCLFIPLELFILSFVNRLLGIVLIINLCSFTYSNFDILKISSIFNENNVPFFDLIKKVFTNSRMLLTYLYNLILHLHHSLKICGCQPFQRQFLVVLRTFRRLTNVILNQWYFRILILESLMLRSKAHWLLFVNL